LLLLALTSLGAIIPVGPTAAQSVEPVPAIAEPNVYEVDALNQGLSTTGTALDLETPQSLFESFLDAGHEGEWNSAATALDLGELTAAQQAQIGPELAQQTFEIVNRSILIDWRSLPDRPDALKAIASSEEPLAGETRRSITLAYLTAEGRDYAFRIARLKTPDGEPVWMISRQTVQNIPALYQRYGPTDFERALPTPLRKQAFWTLAWWEVIALPLIFLVALVAAALVYISIQRIRNRVDEESLTRRIASVVQVPAALVALAGTFAILREYVFNFSGTVAHILDPMQITLFVIAVLTIVVVVIDAVIEFAADRRTEELEDPANEDSRDYFTKLGAGRRLLTVFVVLLGAAIILVQSDITNTLGFSLLASAGLLGLILVFAARQALGDLMASIQIAFAKTARIGDAVHWNGQWCYVERIGFTHLRLRTWDERRVMAPVASFIGESFENWTKTDPSIMTHVELILDHRADIDAMRGELEKFVANDDGVIDPDDAKIQVVDQDERGQTVRFLARAKDPKVGWVMQCRMREAMLAAAARMDESGSNDTLPAFLPREREIAVGRDDKTTAE